MHLDERIMQFLSVVNTVLMGMDFIIIIMFLYYGAFVLIFLFNKLFIFQI